jgi:hypothetical protein
MSAAGIGPAGITPTSWRPSSADAERWSLLLIEEYC